MMKRNMMVAGVVGVIVILALLLANGSPLQHSAAVEGTREYIIPSYVVALTNKPVDEQVASFLATPREERLFEDARAGDNGELIIVATPEQALHALQDTNAWIADIEEWALNEERGYRLTFNEDRTKFTYWIDQHASPIASDAYSRMALMAALEYQIYSGIPADECLVAFTIFDVERDKVFFQSTFPPDAYCVNPSDLITGVPTYGTGEHVFFELTETE